MHERIALSNLSSDVTSEMERRDESSLQVEMEKLDTTCTSVQHAGLDYLFMGSSIG